MNLKLRGKTFPVVVGERLLNDLIRYIKKNKFQKVYMLSDQRLKMGRKIAKKAFDKAKIEFHDIPVQAGEGLKDIESVYPIYGELLKQKADRNSLLVAFGGGSIGDVGGFIASTYLRGIEWVGIPSTLLAQVDSSVGGKTGINHRTGKNLIGTFHQPSLVLCDIHLLHSLGPREIASGIGEITKYAITYDLKFFAYLEKNLDLLLKRDSKTLRYAIEKSIGFKCKAVQKDEFDKTGIREVLNFGHTFGHALETITKYRTYQHGEAVIWGMRFATALSQVRGHLDDESAQRIDALLARIPVPALPKKLNAALVFETMKRDKKASQNKVRFVLLNRIGKSVSDRDVTEADLMEAFERIKK